MGQAIEVEAARIGDAAVFSTDRSITGQDGVSYSSGEEARADARFPGLLAARLFEAIESLRSVFVSSNEVVAERKGGWDDEALNLASRVIGDFFLFYPAAG